MTITINDQGQITIPEEIRTKLGWKPGMEFVVDANDEGDLVLCPVNPAEPLAHPIDQFKDVGDLIWRGTTDEYMAWLREGGPSFFDARRPGEKTFSETAAENTAAFLNMRDAMRTES